MWSKIWRGIFLKNCIEKDLKKRKNAVIGLNFWQTVLSAVAGNCIAGLLIVFVCSVFPEFTAIIFYIVMLIIFAMILYGIIKSIIKKVISRKNKTTTIENETVQIDIQES